MAWSTVHTQAYTTNADSHTFLTYFFDTHLPARTGWTISAHPDASAFKRSVTLSLPSPWKGGSNAACYFWVNWSSTSPTNWNWYEDSTYTTVAGDLGTDTTNVWSTGTAWTNFAGDWRIWDSSTDTQAVLVTKGKKVVFFWPGSAEWMLRDDLNWDGSTDTNGQVLGPFVGQSNRQLICANYPLATGTSTSEYQMTVDVGHDINDWTGLGGGPYWLVPGVQWLASPSTTSNLPATQSIVALPRTGADIAWFLPDNSSVQNRYFEALSSSAWTLLFESNNSKYWLIGSSDLNKQCLALDMGASEPDFS